MNYQHKRLKVLLNMSPLEAAVDDELIKQVVTTKFQDWAYEHEWRYLTKLKHPDEETGFHYIEFSPEFELREIIAGARCERSLADLRRQVFGNTETIKVFRARAAFGIFGMVRQKAEQTLTISPLHQAAGFRSRPRDSNKGNPE